MQIKSIAQNRRLHCLI